MRMVTCIDLSYTTYKRKSLENSSSPTGVRFLEDGLVVPGLYTALSNDKKVVAILHRELEHKIEKVKHNYYEVGGPAAEDQKQYELPA